jgi:glycerol-3-phosphate acyltransferase PlsX
MSGDLGCEAAVLGAANAWVLEDIEITLVGDSAEINAVKEKNLEGMPDFFKIIHAPQVITMEDDPVRAVRAKRDSSMVAGLNALKRGEGDAFISAGNTGALLTGATLVVGRVPTVRRATLGVMLPSSAARGALLLDCGANADCSAEYLLQFALMGSAYMENAQGVAKPRVCLISNGTEEHKGNELTHAAHALLKTAHDEGRLNFAGNMEARDILWDKADVIVCDGFTGNVIIKTIEGAGMLLMSKMKEAMMASAATKLAAAIIKPKLAPLKKMTDYRETGATPILGIAKPVFKAHGSSDEVAFQNAIIGAVEYVESGASDAIAEKFAGGGKA